MRINQIQNIGYNIQMPNTARNYPLFDEARVNEITNQKEAILPQLDIFLREAKYQEQVIEALYILNRMLDNGTKGIEKMYPTFSRFNDINNPNIQVLLAGIYRKTLVPDAFGPLNKMMMKQTFYPNSPYFDPTEEIGGAILEYIRKR